MVSCAKSGDKANTPDTSLNLTGTWNFLNVQCYDPTLSSNRTAANTTSGYTEQIVISNGQYTSTVTQGGCTVQFTGNISADSSSGLTLTNRRISSATAGGCSITMNINNAGIIPLTNTVTYMANNFQNDLTNTTFYSNGTATAIGLPTSYTDQFPGDLCFFMYQKQ